MTATAARIAFITQAVRVVTAGPDSSVETKYGYAARDTEEPIETFFDAVADAQEIADERLLLLKADRRRIEFALSGVATGMAFNYKGTTPAATMIDDDRGLNQAAVIAQFSIDFQRGKTNAVCWG